MKRSVLSPEQAAWLAQTFDRNRKYAGMRMEAGEGGEGGEGGDGSGDGGDAGKAAESGADDKLGEGGKKALEAERTRAKAAEDAAKATKTEFDTLKAALLEGLGIKSEDANKGDDVLKTVQEQLAAIQRESAVLKLANTHKITDEGDLKILASATDAEQMKALAERLAPTEDDPDAKSRNRNRPKPDRTQGGGDGDSSGSTTGSVKAAKEQYLESRRKKTA